jgi:hypothetical protein
LGFLTDFRQSVSGVDAEPAEAPAAEGLAEPARTFSGYDAATVPPPSYRADSSFERPAPPPAAAPSWAVAPPAPAKDGAKRRRRWERIAMAVVLAATAGGLAFIAVRNDQTAAKWRRLDQAQIQVSTSAGRQVQTANTNISQLNAEVKSLDSQVASTQSQLSSVANQKEKAIDQTTVFRDLLAAAGQVADNLQQCIAATDQLGVDVNTIVASGNAAALGPLQNEATSVAATCAQAQQGNQALQAAIQSAS